MAFVSEDGKRFGYIDTAGTFVVSPQFSLCKPFSEGLAAVCINERWGYIDRQGTLWIPAVFEGQYATAFRCGLAGARIDGKAGFIDRTGRFVIQPQFEEVLLFSEGTACVKRLGKWGLINEEGRQVVECCFEDLRNMFGGFAPATAKRALYRARALG